MASIQTYLDSYNRDGYVVVPDVFNPERAASACREMENLFYGMSFEEYLAKSDKEGEYAPLETAYGHQFPCGKDPLDGLIENDYLLDLMEAILGTDQIRFLFGGLFLRSGPTDTVPGGFGIEHPWQGYHTDHHTACYLPHTQDSHFNAYLIAGAFLHDIDDDNVPMQLIPGSHKQIPGLIPRLIEEGIFSHWCAIRDIREVPEFAPPVPAKGKAGSVLLRSSYGVHAAIPFRNKRNRRATWGFTVCSSTSSDWMTRHIGERGLETKFTHAFWAKTTPRVRSLFGWPMPGHPYYTSETLSLLASWYPGIDLSPYEEQLAGN